ncbi:polysaccharide deacetylase family protein [Halovenus salina]|uniref:Polysaccharide deacetylase family protein n=1 Tax=Halovenus salina TaxID=1510225 RepID=A0ABD5W4X9_9EURY|nr:polysaccharide deacetylase family protein [Halovenus salina]
MKAVMYHYVRDGVDRLPNYYYLDITDFRKQLDYFDQEFGFVERESFLAYLRGVRSTPPSGVILTFDDGLRDHYEFVFAELQKRDLWGIFYVPTGPYQTETLLDVHKTHILLGEVSGSELLAETHEIIEEKMIPHRRREEYKTKTYKTHDDIKATKEVKRILNYYVSDEFQTEVLDRLAARIGHEPVDVSDYYVRPEELREMYQNGMTIGAHTVNHPVLSKLDKREQELQIHDSFAHLDDILGDMTLRTFCYPYGNDATYNEITVELLNSCECEWCFKVESADITDEDIGSRPQALPRYDCNEFPYGEASGSIGTNSK